MKQHNKILQKEVNLFLPVSKDLDGSLVGILSDTSMDRDEEFIGKELIESWAKKHRKGLPALANHTNQMGKWVGGWKNLKVISKGRNTALVGTPWFFDETANPLAAQIERQIEQSMSKGLNPGISISAIIHESEDVEIDGKKHRKFTKGELLEATWVPIQSNRNANFGHVAKQFGLLDKSGKYNTEEENSMNQEELDIKVAEYDDKVAAFKAKEKKLADKEAKLKVAQAELETAKAAKKTADADKEAEKAKEAELTKMVEAVLDKKLSDRKFMLKALGEVAPTKEELAKQKKEAANKDLKPTADNILRAMYGSDDDEEEGE